MAELIPPEYRIQVARQQLVSRWIVLGFLAAAIAVAGLISTALWRQKQARLFAALNTEYHAKAELIQRAAALQAQRTDLADRMKKLQALRDDKILLSLLKNISDGFSDNECLQFIQINAHNNDIPNPKFPTPQYSVRVHGITASYTTHTQLLERLTAIGTQSDPPIHVPLGEKQLKELADSEVILFDLNCEQPLVKSK